MKFKKTVSFWVTFLQRLRDENLAIPPSPEEVEAIISARVSAFSTNADAFPVHDVVYYGKSQPVKEADIDSWLLIIKLFLRLDCANACSAYFDRMLDTYNKVDLKQKIWLGDSFVPTAIERLGREADIYGADSFELLSRFFKFALVVYVNRTIVEKNGQFSISTFLTAVKRSGDATYLTAKCVLPFFFS